MSRRRYGQSCPRCDVGPFDTKKAYDYHVARCRAPAPEPAAAPAVLICSECGAGPFATTKGYGAHVRTHQKLRCDDCGRECAGPTGLGQHRHRAHGVPAARTTRNEPAPALPRRLRDLPETLQVLLPGSPLVDRLTEFVTKNDPDQTLWVVATADAGPWLCRVGQIGLLAQREKTPIVAVHVAAIYDHITEHPAEDRATA